MSEKKVSLNNFKGFVDDIDPKSVENMVNSGDFLNTLKIKKDTRYTVKVIGMPYNFDSQFGKTLALPIEYDEMKYSLIVPKSLKIQLIVAMIRNNIDFKGLIGKQLNVIKEKGDTKEYKDALLYRCAIVD